MKRRTWGEESSGVAEAVPLVNMAPEFDRDVEEGIKAKTEGDRGFKNGSLSTSSVPLFRKVDLSRIISYIGHTELAFSSL